MSKEQADKISEMLRAVLTNQKNSQIDAKLDELLRIARQMANPYGTNTTYEPNGFKRIETPSTGATTVDQSLIAVFQEMVGKQKVGDWNGILRLAQTAIQSDPGWFTPDAFSGLAQLKLCRTDQARASLTKFMAETEGATAFAEFREQAQRFLADLDTENYKATCVAHIGNQQ